MEVSPPGGVLIDLYFTIEGPGIVERMLRFIQETRGQVQYGDWHELPTGRKIRTFRDPSIVVGQYVGVDVQLFKNSPEDDHFFLVIAGPDRNVIRLRLFGPELVANVITALESLHRQLTDSRAEPPNAADA